MANEKENITEEVITEEVIDQVGDMLSDYDTAEEKEAREKKAAEKKETEESEEKEEKDESEEGDEKASGDESEDEGDSKSDDEGDEKEDKDAGDGSEDKDDAKAADGDKGEKEESGESDEGTEKDDKGEKEEEPTELEILTKANEALRKTVVEFTKPEKIEGKEEESSEEEDASKGKKPIKVDLPEIGEDGKTYEFMTKEEGEAQGFDETQIALFNKMSNQIVLRTQRNTLLSIPAAVKEQVQSEVGIQTMTREFFSANPDLLEYKDMTSIVANKMMSKEGTTLEGMFSKLGTEVRDRLGLTKPAKDSKKESHSKEGKRKPAFANKQKSSKRISTEPKQKATGMQGDINSLIEPDDSSV